jgi:hypothetical protein
MNELRMQNENLRQVQRFFEEHSTPYRYLYELAPIGHHRKKDGSEFPVEISGNITVHSALVNYDGEPVIHCSSPKRRLRASASAWVSGFLDRVQFADQRQRLGRRFRFSRQRLEEAAAGRRPARCRDDPHLRHVVGIGGVPIRPQHRAFDRRQPQRWTCLISRLSKKGKQISSRSHEGLSGLDLHTGQRYWITTSLPGRCASR